MVTDLSKVHISLFGAFSFEAVGGRVRFPTRSAERLLAYLLLRRGRPVSRRVLAGTLWPDSDDGRAARNLNTTIWRVRTTLESHAIENLRLQSDAVHILASADGAEVDAIGFNDLTARIPKLSGAERMAAMLDAEALYKGDLLEGMDDEWVIPERSAARARYTALLFQLVEACLVSRDYADGLVYAEKLVALDPLNEGGHRAMMLLSSLSGNRSGALAHYRQLKGLLHDELGVEPAQETTNLWSHIRSGASRSVLLRWLVMVAR